MLVCFSAAVLLRSSLLLPLIGFSPFALQIQQSAIRGNSEGDAGLLARGPQMARQSFNYTPSLSETKAGFPAEPIRLTFYQ